jgi:uncharacterized membrane protein HdeD (DUF308 family)
MPVVLVKNWWALVLRGAVAISLGVVTFVWPGITLGTLVILFGIYALIDGLLSLAGVVRAAESHERKGILPIEALTGLIVGVVAMSWPGITAFWLVYLIAAWALVTGVFEIVAAIRLRRRISGEWLLALSGIASLILGILVISIPLAGALAIAYWIGVYAFVFGVLLVALGLRLRVWMDPIASS